MKMHHLSRFFWILAAAFLFQLSSPAIVEANDDEQGWKVIGIRAVNEKLKMSPIPVGAKKGTFNQIRIQVTKSPLKVSHIVLHFEDETQESIPYGKTFSPGTTSRNVQIKSGAQEIKKVIVYYSGVSKAGNKKPLTVAKKPTVAVWGRLKATDQ